MVIFETKIIGSVVKIDDAKVVGQFQQRLFSVDGQGGRLGEDFAAFKAIVMGVEINGSSNVQFQQTLGDDIYLNVFGDRIGRMKVSGIAVAGSCENGDAEHGIIKILRFYRANKVSQRADPITVTLGSTSYKGYLVAFNGGMMGEQMTIQRFFQFSLEFVLPKDENK